MAEELTEEQISKELERIFYILERNYIYLDVLGEYEDRTIYKFITEKLFDYELTEIDFPKLATHFTYEDFCPNPKLDAEDHKRFF